ncbi:MAG: helix-turn-helix domain-containing protein [Desulfuromonadales bacterium]|nr:helix-turn-helix domain-containing protein [Desulfuromonadales bacterium]
MGTDRWLTLDELAVYLKLGRTKLYRMAQNGEIPASKVGSQWRFDREEIDAWMKSQRPDSSAGQGKETGKGGGGDKDHDARRFLPKS